MEKAHGLRQPSPPMKPGGSKRAAVPPRGAFSAQMLRPPSTPTDSSLPDEFNGEINDYAFATSRSEVDSQASSPPPPPPSLYHSSPRVRRPMTARTSSSVKGIPTGQTPLGSVKSKAASPSNNDEDAKKQNMDNPTPSVHPIDTLSRKLRQQAMELTHVYEELEKQNVKIDAYKQQIEDQKLQLEKLREKRRNSIDGSSKTSRSSRTAALEQQKRATQMMIGTPSTGASLGQKREELDCKLKEAEREKKKYQLAAKRIEKALVELQVFQNDRMEKLLPSEGESNQVEDSCDFQAVLNEQRAYIRVLEEAVHLKATDFEITGHEELLVVLAELRHTIYEQEEDVQEKANVLASIQQQLEQEQQQHLETKNILASTQKQQEEIANRFHEQESAFHVRIHQVEQQLLEKDRHLNQLHSVSTDAQRTEEALQSRLTAATKTQNLTQAKLQDATRNIKSLQEKLHGITSKYKEAQQQVGNLREESSKKQSHLDEMNALQEELLGSVDKYVGKVKKSRDKVDRLEDELESCKEKEALTQKQLQEAARSSDERVSILKAEVDAAEQRTQQIQAQRTALEQEKNRLEDALAEVQQQLEGQEQERNEQQQEIAEKEQRYHQMEEAVAELEAALSTVLMMMLGKTPDPSEKQSMTEDEEDDTDKHALLLDQSVLRELETCCQALNTLTTENGPKQSTTLCSSFTEILARVATIGERVVNEVNRALASWARERTNLVEACATLDATAKMCQNEMEKRHDEIQDYREQLAERASEVEAYAMQLDTLDEQLRSAQAECEAFYALEEHATRQEEALQAKQALIRDLSAENDRLSAVENAYSVQVATNARYSQRLEDQHEAIKEQKQCAKELEQALENAANFTEEQNECNQQLQSQLAEMEISQRKQADLAKTSEVQNAAFSSRFLRLIKQYTTFLRPVAATDRSLQDHLNLFDAEFQNGDILRLLQLFPALLEEYISTCTSNPIDSRGGNKSSITSNSTKKKPHRVSPDKPQIDMATTKWQPPPPEPPSSKTPSLPIVLNAAVTRNHRYSIPAEKEEAQLAEQLELIRGAFQSYKGDVETER
ncbi:hypothetical protein PI124_g18035 [Phytophthora idaei]|nr:hypothetical protein PI125_g18789 [Phytophthora idaei]KAG3137573.1 hypothetical protein PI126_g17331 [Phytophthora idaei]KAG3236963.1 hypothetical protein PI124_g18035 [Phytophthora idaei]